MSTSSEITGTESAYPTSFKKHDDIGLTKREYFAGLAMQGLVSRAGENPSVALDTELAVNLADALLEALEDD